jgi:hypothetical protein
MDGFTAKDPLSNTPLNTPSFTFGSEAANLEYSILTAILGDPSPESNPTSDSHSSASPPPSVHHFSACPSEYSASWTSAPGNSLLPSEPNGFLPSSLVTVSDIQTIFEDSQLTLPFIDPSDRLRVSIIVRLSQPDFYIDRPRQQCHVIICSCSAGLVHNIREFRDVTLTVSAESTCSSLATLFR